MIDAIFNFRNLWDGAANNVFNGSSQWGDRDPNAGVWVRTSPTRREAAAATVNASLASQALDAAARQTSRWVAARELRRARAQARVPAPLEDQQVHWDDGVLGAARAQHARAARAGTRDELLRADHAGVRAEVLVLRGAGRVRRAGPAPMPLPYSQLEANFAMFFGLAIQLYEATLISDDSRFDRSAVDVDGIPTELDRVGAQRLPAVPHRALRALPHRARVHAGRRRDERDDGRSRIRSRSAPRPCTISTTRNVVTRASVSGGPGILDTGFASNGVTLEEWDRGLGASDPFGNPLSFADQYLQLLAGNTAGAGRSVRRRGASLRSRHSHRAERGDTVLGLLHQAQGVLPQSQNTENCFQSVGAFIPTRRGRRRSSPARRTLACSVRRAARSRSRRCATSS